MLNDKINYEITKREMEIINILRRMESSHNDNVYECGEDIKKFILDISYAMDNFHNMDDEDYWEISTLIGNAGTDMHNSAEEISEISERNDDWNTAQRNKK